MKPKMSKPRKEVTLPKQLEKTQKAFNAYIRKRDVRKGCISCRSPRIDHASHFYPVGQFSLLRFNEDNVHGSCIRCNYFMHGNLNSYRVNLVDRIGRERLLMLDSLAAKKVHKWGILELQVLEKEYKQKTKELL